MSSINPNVLLMNTAYLVRYFNIKTEVKNNSTTVIRDGME
jgi:hypothetical protein